MASYFRCRKCVRPGISWLSRGYHKRIAFGIERISTVSAVVLIIYFI